MSFNPISALTHATLVDICQEPATRQLAADMMREAQAIAEKLGVTFRVPLEKRIEGAEKVGKHKTSTLQDVEAGRAVEVDALIGSVIELAELTGTPAPASRAVHALLKQLVATMREKQRAGDIATALVPLRCMHVTSRTSTQPPDLTLIRVIPVETDIALRHAAWL